MSAKPKRDKKKCSSKRSFPTPISKNDLSESLDVIRDDPSFILEQTEAVWDWAELRRGGKLQERVRVLDRHFIALAKTQKICPIVLLLANGEHE